MKAERRIAGTRQSVGRWAALTLALPLLVSCGTEHQVDYEAYERIPHRRVSAGLRVVAMSTPATRKTVFYGHYGGPGNSGGEPVDQMDDLFRRHDIVYSLARTRRTMVVADRSLVDGLRGLDQSALSAEAEAYRERVIRFFEAPVSRVVGKPWSTLYCVHERRDCCFARAEAVREFFAEDHPGMPGLARSPRDSVGRRTPGATAEGAEHEVASRAPREDGRDRASTGIRSRRVRGRSS